MRTTTSLSWTVGHCKSMTDIPERRVPATVPGAVQLDWARAEGYRDYAYADHYKDYLWMEDKYWSYEAVLEPSELGKGESLFWVCKGIDYQFVVRLDGEELLAQEGMFTPIELELTGKAKPGSRLEVRIYPAPKREDAPPTRAQADQCCKPAVSYGWDWHPRLIPLGIWDDTYLEVRPAHYIRSTEVSYRLSADLSKATLSAEVALNGPCSGELLWTIADPSGQVAYKTAIEGPSDRLTVTTVLENPALWWPNGHGVSALYTSTFTLKEMGGETDYNSSRIGFRTVRLVMHPEAWKEPSQFPKSRSTPPITLEINGRSLFAKGSNWVNPDIFPGRITKDTYEPLVRLAVEANFNLFRIWGGGIVNKQSFFDLCDELGMMVWQEFPLACNNYEGTPEYLRILDQESRSIIHRLRPHASLVMWCGGNELFNSWSKMTDQSLALRLLNRNSYDLDPGRPFLMTSPVMGMGHGHYVFRDEKSGEEVFEWMRRSTNTAYTEFGCPSPSSVDILKRIIPQEELFPPRPGTSWEVHHAFGAWQGDTWLSAGTIEHYFGASASLEELVERGQLLQSEGYKCIYEEGRRQKPVCSMTLNWCYNEAWPTAANNSLISYPCEPKPAYYAVAASCRPVLASARLSKFAWKAGERFDPELWLLNDSPVEVPSGTIEAVLVADQVEMPLLSWSYPPLAANTNMAGPIIQFVLPEMQASKLELRLNVASAPELSSVYTLIFRPQHSESLVVPSTPSLNM